MLIRAVRRLWRVRVGIARRGVMGGVWQLGRVGGGGNCTSAGGCSGGDGGGGDGGCGGGCGGCG